MRLSQFLSAGLLCALLMPTIRAHAAQDDFQQMLHDPGFGAAVTPPPARLPSWARPMQGVTPRPPIPAPSADWVLPNGLRLIVRSVRGVHHIFMCGTVQQNGDLEEAPGKEGVAELTKELLRQSARDHDALGAAGAEFAVMTPPEALAHALEMVVNLELHPVFDPTELATIRESMASTLQKKRQTPQDVFSRAALSATLPKGDPFLRETTPRTIRSLTRSDVVTYYNRAYRPDVTIIEIVGDIDPQAARTIIMRAFGGWHASGHRPAVILPAIGPMPVTTLRVQGEGRLLDTVLLQEPIGLRFGQADTIRFLLAKAVLSVGTESRLVQALHVRRPLVEAVHSDLGLDTTRAVFTIAFASPPELADIATADAMNALRGMCLHPISKTELIRAQAAFLTAMRASNNSMVAQARHDLRFAAAGLPLTQTDRDLETVESATPAQVQDVFCRTVQPGKLSLLILGPPPPAKAPH